MQENNNKYVSSRGLMKSCNFISSTPISSIRKLINYPDIKLIELLDNPIIYICSSAIPDFINNYFQKIDKQFIIVSGDCDESIPNDIFRTEQEYLNFIENDKIIHWFCQNFTEKHKKITNIPIGLDYHTMTKKTIWGNITSCNEQEKLLELIKNKGNPYSSRKLMCYANFHFTMTTKYSYDRKNAILNVPKKLVHYEIQKINRLQTWNNQKDYAFVISPHGGGYDCHRTWEALILGCIPIVKTSKIDILYKDLPVLIVNNWSDINETLLAETVYNFSKINFKTEKLLLNYWNNEIRRHFV